MGSREREGRGTQVEAMKEERGTSQRGGIVGRRRMFFCEN